MSRVKFFLWSIKIKQLTLGAAQDVENALQVAPHRIWRIFPVDETSDAAFLRN